MFQDNDEVNHSSSIRNLTRIGQTLQKAGPATTGGGQGSHGPPLFKVQNFLLDTKHFYQIMITIYLSFLSLGTNKYSGKCILGQPETLVFKIFWGNMPQTPLEGPKKYLSPLKTFFGHPTFKNASRALENEHFGKSRLVS